MEVSLSPKCRWDYRGEGHRNIVVADVKTRLVYRMTKRPRKRTLKVPSPEENIQMQCQSVKIHNQLQMIADYAANVVAPLIPSVFIVPPRLVDFHGKKLSELSRSIESVRPARRLNSELDPASRYALALPDFCFAPCPFPIQSQPPTISIEIKPKKGFIPTSSHISKYNQVKRDICRFCLHNSLKVKKGVRPQSSRYCPIDLYSGNVHRMKHALHCLLETPHNNLRICKNGQEVFGEAMRTDLPHQLEEILSSLNWVEKNGLRRDRCISVFLDLAIQALLWCPNLDNKLEKPVTSSESQPVQYCTNSSYKISPDENSAEVLPAGCILDILLHIQRLDDLDIEGVILLYKQLKQYFLDTPECDSESCQLDGPYTGASWAIPRPQSAYLSEVELIIQKLKEFLVSMTVQDCSILIAIQPINRGDADDINGDISAIDGDTGVMNENDDVGDTRRDIPEQILVDSEGQRYRFSVNVIDLDPKPFDKIVKYFKVDHDILEAYRKSQMNSQSPQQAGQSGRTGPMVM